MLCLQTNLTEFVVSDIENDEIVEVSECERFDVSDVTIGEEDFLQIQEILQNKHVVLNQCQSVATEV